MRVLARDDEFYQRVAEKTRGLPNSRIFDGYDLQQFSHRNPIAFIGGHEFWIVAGNPSRIKVGCIDEPVTWWADDARVSAEFLDKNRRFDPRIRDRYIREGHPDPTGQALIDTHAIFMRWWLRFKPAFLLFAQLLTDRLIEEGPEPTTQEELEFDRIVKGTVNEAGGGR